MKRNYPLLPFCRYADDGVVYCRTESETRALKKALEERFNECRLELHPEKTRIVYCKNSNRRKDYPVVSFDFFGFTFRPRSHVKKECVRKSMSASPHFPNQGMLGLIRKKKGFGKSRNPSLLSHFGRLEPFLRFPRHSIRQRATVILS